MQKLTIHDLRNIRGGVSDKKQYGFKKANKKKKKGGKKKKKKVGK